MLRWWPERRQLCPPTVMPDVKINLECLDGPFEVTVEPWAGPVFKVLPGEHCNVVVHHPEVIPTVTNAVVDGGLFIIAHEAGSTFSFVRKGIVEFSIPPHLALPELSSGSTGGA